MGLQEEKDMDEHIKEINRIINKVVQESPTSLSSYLSGGSVKMNKKKTKKELNMCQHCMGGTIVPVGFKLQKIKKERSDKNKVRDDNEWISLVKHCAETHNVPYNKALKIASEMRKKGRTMKDF